MNKIILLFLLSFSCIAQRKIPYPIILVHGLNNDDGAWLSNLENFKSLGLGVDIDQTRKRVGNGSRLDFCLNADNDKTRSLLNRKAGVGGVYGDVQEYTNTINPNNDVFVVNFGDNICMGNNESAIVKQGFAIGLAVKKVLEITQANYVILVGHSMGGLAIREYITNNEDWINKYGRHCVAHVVTIGTPHGGSDMTSAGIFPFEDSEAVRDLRTRYLGTGNQCAFLFGGIESSSYMRPTFLTFDNVDVNCNGIINESIVGLNDRPLPNDISYISMIGNYIDDDKLNLHGDGIVTTKSQNLFNYQKPTTYLYNTITIKAKHSTSAPIIGGEIEQNFTLEILQAIQFASVYGQIQIPLNKTFLGAFVNRFEYSDFTSNSYKFYVFKGGKLKLTSTNPFGFNNIQVVNRDKGEIIIPYVNNDLREYTLASGGNYMIVFTSKSFTRGVQPYTFKTEYCQFPDAPVISANFTSICQGEQAELSAPAGFDSYTWFLNGTEVQRGVNTSFKAEKTGTYTMQAFGCGTNVVSINQIDITVKPLPTKPTVSVTESGLKSSSTTGNQWYLNGEPIQGANQQTLTEYGAGNYTVKLTNSDCSVESSFFVITGTEDKYSEIKLYPNPSGGKLSLLLPQEKQQLTIVDYTGKILLEKEVTPDKSELILEVGFLNAGGYVLQTKTNAKSRTFKFVIIN